MSRATNLARRDLRRATKVFLDMAKLPVLAPIHATVSVIAKALKREREQVSFEAVNYFFATKAKQDRAAVVILGTKEKSR